MNATLVRINLLCTSALLLTLAGVPAAADQPGIRAGLYPENERKRSGLVPHAATPKLTAGLRTPKPP